jgi:hypothetical protein
MPTYMPPKCALEYVPKLKRNCYTKNEMENIPLTPWISVTMTIMTPMDKRKYRRVTTLLYFSSSAVTEHLINNFKDFNWFKKSAYVEERWQLSENSDKFTGWTDGVSGSDFALLTSVQIGSGTGRDSTAWVLFQLPKSEGDHTPTYRRA